MLKRRPKRRYLSIKHAGQSRDSVNAIIKRCSELFGSIAVEKAAIRLVQEGEKESIIKCRLEHIENVLVAITLIDPPAVTAGMSGTIKQLRSRGNGVVAAKWDELLQNVPTEQISIVLALAKYHDTGTWGWEK
jgi:RNase P/RNase MRP subunit POP5